MKKYKQQVRDRSDRYKNMKKIAVLLICSLLIVQVCGCSAKTEQVISEPSVSITYSWWGNDDRNAYTLSEIDEFENEQNGRIDVECKYSSWSGYENRMHIYMKSKNTPDVMLINYSWLDEYSTDGTGFYDFYEVADHVNLDNYTKDDLAFGIKIGKLNAIPISFNTSIFYFNKTIYDKYCLDVPTTWDELFHAAEVMRKDDVYTLGVTEKQAFLLVDAYYVQTTGKDLTDASGKLTVTSEDVGAMLDFYARLVNGKVIMPIDSFTREAGRLVGYEKLADDKREQNADRLDILPPVFEKENIYDSFKANADYYLYGRKSEEEVVDAIMQSFYE